MCIDCKYFDNGFCILSESEITRPEVMGCSDEETDNEEY